MKTSKIWAVAARFVLARRRRVPGIAIVKAPEYSSPADSRRSSSRRIRIMSPYVVNES
jgi:hypothetical protein